MNYMILSMGSGVRGSVRGPFFTRHRFTDPSETSVRLPGNSGIQTQEAVFRIKAMCIHLTVFHISFHDSNKIIYKTIYNGIKTLKAGMGTIWVCRLSTLLRYELAISGY